MLSRLRFHFTRAATTAALVLMSSGEARATLLDDEPPQQSMETAAQGGGDADAAQPAPEPMPLKRAEEARSNEGEEGAQGEKPAENPLIPPHGFFRLDVDQATALSMLASGFHGIGPIFLANTLFASARGNGSFATGIGAKLGAVILTAQAGMEFNYFVGKANNISAQLFVIIPTRWVYYESWNLAWFNTVFAEGAPDIFWTKHILLVNAHPYLQIGPQFELVVAMKNSPLPDGSALMSAPVGGRMNVTIKEGHQIGLWVARETREVGPEQGKLQGRLSYIRRW